MSHEHLPFDLTHIIISRHADENTFRACSLVSRLWHQASRPDIFCSIQITDRDKLAAFGRLLDGDPDIAELVQELIVQPYHPPDEPIPLPTPWVAQFPDILSSRLIKLQTMQFVQLFDYGEYLDHDFFRRLSAFSTVDRLVLRNRASLSYS